MTSLSELADQLEADYLSAPRPSPHDRRARDTESTMHDLVRLVDLIRTALT